MIYEVRANLFFKTLEIPDKLKQAILLIWQHAQVVNPGQENEECSVVDVIKCYHDEDPSKPCESIFHKDNSPRGG